VPSSSCSRGEVAEPRVSSPPKGSSLLVTWSSFGAVGISLSEMPLSIEVEIEEVSNDTISGCSLASRSCGGEVDGSDTNDFVATIGLLSVESVFSSPGLDVLCFAPASPANFSLLLTIFAVNVDFWGPADGEKFFFFFLFFFCKALGFSARSTGT